MTFANSCGGRGVGKRVLCANFGKFMSNLKRKDHNHVHLSNVLVPVLVHCSVNMQICNCQICLQAKNIEICKVMGHIMLKLNGESSFYEITRFFCISFYFYL